LEKLRQRRDPAAAVVLSDEFDIGAAEWASDKPL
jgi:hypothetical protein